MLLFFFFFLLHLFLLFVCMQELIVIYETPQKDMSVSDPEGNRKAKRLKADASSKDKTATPKGKAKAKARCPTQKGAELFLKKLTTLKSDLETATYNSSEVLNAIATDPSWDDFNNEKMLKSIRQCRNNVEEAKMGSPFWRAWSTPNWKEVVKKTWSNEALLTQEQNMSAGKMAELVKALASESQILRDMHAASQRRKIQNL